MYRALHFSDVHVDLPLGQFPFGTMFNKRFVGFANLALRRRHRFAAAREKLAALAAFARDQQVGALLCTGDFTVLGTHPEYAVAKAAIGDLLALDAPFVTVPGNHDVYLPDTRADDRFNHYFGELLVNDCPDLATEDGWPRVRLLDSKVAAVCVDSARPNPQVWRSSGRIPDAQLERLGAALSDPRLADRFVFVMTHYAPRRRDGTPDTRHHGLDNADELLSVCAGMRGAVLHGHIHHRYSLEAQGVRIFGAGSATDRGREGLWLFECTPQGIRALPGSWNGSGYVLEPSGAIEL
ncbi:MAG: metallophosphoesterase [Myxococcales bacterium]|nr:metallophosphoesterase [Myxococcales bacterium]MDD9970606.1 metallophosphoesterase [Myxococcales bacterium]